MSITIGRVISRILEIAASQLARSVAVIVVGKAIVFDDLHYSFSSRMLRFISPPGPITATSSLGS
ncbi:MAG: hypothetical protein IPM83_16250 [Ignavibacteria bacterium]|nr:hypothetical protein [Ignavibacteria bacterium]